MAKGYNILADFLERESVIELLYTETPPYFSGSDNICDTFLANDHYGRMEELTGLPKVAPVVLIAHSTWAQFLWQFVYYWG